MNEEDKLRLALKYLFQHIMPGMSELVFYANEGKFTIKLDWPDGITTVKVKLEE